MTKPLQLVLLVTAIVAFGNPPIATSQSHLTGSRPVTPITGSVSPDLAAFCSAPVDTICRGESGRTERLRNRERFQKSRLGQIAEEPPLRRLMANLKSPADDFPQEKSEAWWNTFEQFIGTYLDRIRVEGGNFNESFQAIRAHLQTISLQPGYSSLTQQSRLNAFSIILSRSDLQSISPANRRRAILRAIFEACYEHGTSDNAVNVQYRTMAICPNSLAKALWKKQQAGVSGNVAWGLTKTLGHEVGHCLEFHLQPGAYSELESCLHRHYSRPGSDNASLASHEFRPFMDEITSDYWGSHALTRTLGSLEPNQRIAFLQAELEDLCDERGTQWEFTPLSPEGSTTAMRGAAEFYKTHSHTGTREPSHPRGDYRINFIAQQPFLRSALGCPSLPTRATPACAFRGAAPPARY